MEVLDLLIVDDTEDWRQALQHIFQDAGYHAQSAWSYSEAIAILGSFLVKLVILDERLVDSDWSNTDGSIVVDWISNNSANTKIIIYSAYAGTAMTRRYFKYHQVQGCYNKSDEISRLRNHVKDLLQPLD